MDKKKPFFSFPPSGARSQRQGERRRPAPVDATPPAALASAAAPAPAPPPPTPRRRPPTSGPPPPRIRRRSRQRLLLAGRGRGEVAAVRVLQAASSRCASSAASPVAWAGPPGRPSPPETRFDAPARRTWPPEMQAAVSLLHGQAPKDLKAKAQKGARWSCVRRSVATATYFYLFEVNQCGQ
ncbi:hypothetical protein PVAP13_8NG170803 [Panicum virgatum]|uniref:Uncharacterized protein n=1 Tax=Panicum virgatum TaxID=38727 RepID=A0A8T0P6M7_PANVG|nr:hypothetical protein PVAP13_8NG170803 [Panicum virgatum]